MSDRAGQPGVLAVVPVPVGYSLDRRRPPGRTRLREGPEGSNRRLPHSLRVLPALRLLQLRPAGGQCAPYFKVTGARGAGTTMPWPLPVGHAALAAHTRPLETGRSPGSRAVDR